MNFNPEDTIEGIRISEIRKLFITKDDIYGPGYPSHTVEEIQEKFNINSKEALSIVKKLQELELLDKEKNYENRFLITKKGKLFGLEKNYTPITREEADSLYVGFLEKIKIANTDPNFLHKITGFILFGNYASGTGPIREIQVELLYDKKDPDNYNEKRDALSEERKAPKNIDWQYNFPVYELRKYLKEGTRRLSVYLDFETKELPIPLKKFFDMNGNLIETVSSQSTVIQTNVQAEITTTVPEPEEDDLETTGIIIFNNNINLELKETVSREYKGEVKEYRNFHKQIIIGLTRILKNQYPEWEVSAESFKSKIRTRVDVARKSKEGIKVLYEVKTYSTAMESIRFAIGQLLEYAFYPRSRESEEFYIVSHIAATKRDLIYLKHLGERLGIKMGYIHYNCDTNKIDDNMPV